MSLLRVILALAVVAGIASWLAEALVTAAVTGEGSFIDHLILQVPPDQIFHRVLVFLLFVGLGVTVAALLSRQERSRRFCRAVVEAMGHSLIRLDREGRLRWSNDAFHRMLGRDEQELIGRSIAELTTSSSQDAVAQICSDDEDACLQDRRVSFATVDGGEVPALIRCIPVSPKPQTAGCFFVVRDISDRQRAAESEQRSQIMLQNLLDATSDHALLLHPDGRLAGLNAAVAEILGATVEELQGRVLYDCLDDETAANRREVVETVFRTGQSSHQVAEYAGRWFDHRIDPILDEQGRAIYVVVFARDITEQRRAEEALTESEQRYRTLFETTGTSICMVEEDGTISLVNRHFAAEAGYEREQIEGKMSFLDFIAPHELERVNRYRRKRLEGDESAPGSYEIDFVDREGTTRRALIAVDLIPGTMTSVASLIDITERIRAEQVLKEQATIIEQAHDMIMTTDLEGRIVDVNRAEQQALGMPLEELLELTIFDISDDRRTQQEILDQTIEVGDWHGEVANTTIDGEEIILDCRTFALRDEAGNPTKLVGISRDVTRRKRTEEQIERASHERAMIMDAMSEVVVLQDLDHVVLAVNRTAAESAGLPPEEMIGRRCYELWEHGLERCDDCPISETLATGLPSSGERTTSDGRIWDITFDPVMHDGELVAVVEVARDVSERRRQQEEVAELNQFRQSVIDQVNIWVQVLDREGRVLLWNPAAEEISGYSSQDVLGDNSIWERLYPDPALRETVSQFRRQIIEEGRVAEGDHTVITTREGRERVMSWDSRRLLDPSGEPIGSIAVGRDITRSLELEEQLRQAAKMEAIGRLAGGIAHDFNNMLTAILGNAQLLTMRDHSGEDAALIEEIRIAANRSADLVGQLLAFSRKQVLAPEVLDINEIIEEMEPILSRMMGEKIGLLVNLEPSLGPVRADATQMRQVLMNLVVNARDALPDGGHITIDTRNVQLDDEYVAAHAQVEPGHYAMISVSDTGIGMDDQTRSHIFEPFFTTKGEDAGVGLGLATVYGIVNQSGGHIEVYSEPDQGTIFKVYMPLIEGAAQQTTAGGKSPALPDERVTVMVVEDEQSVLKMMMMTLEKSGYNVIGAVSGEDALRLAVESDAEIDLLITDVVMPGMSGVDLAEKLVEDHPDLPTLFLSGYTDSVLIHNGTLAESTNYLQKPFATEELLRTVHRILDSG